VDCLSVTRKAYLGILLFGLISLFGDIVYEGARGVLPTYLELLGASAFLVGLVFGLSDALCFGFRLLSGYVADVTRAYWVFMLLGYGLIIALPSIGLASGLWLVIALILTERVGKALRTPARNTLLSVVGESVGAGKTFGLHELLDQVGAISGPLIMALLLRYVKDFNLSFIALYAPYAALALVLFLTYKTLKSFVSESIKQRYKFDKASLKSMPKSLWLYIAAVFANTMGLIHVTLMLYKAYNYFEAWFIPLLYLVVQAVDAGAAPIAGWLYDKIGRKILLVPFAISMMPSILALTGGREALIAAMVFFGLVLGMQESVYRATIADLAPLERRGLAYGLFDSAYGFGFMASGMIFGFIMTTAIPLIGVIYSIILELSALTLLSLSLVIKK